MSRPRLKVKCPRCDSEECFDDRRPDRIYQCSGCGAVNRFLDSDLIPETCEERDRRLVEDWSRGHHRDVADEVAKMRRCDVILFTIALAGRVNLNAPMELARILRTMKWPN